MAQASNQQPASHQQQVTGRPAASSRAQVVNPSTRSKKIADADCLRICAQQSQQPAASSQQPIHHTHKQQTKTSKTVKFADYSD
jgi:hypothetical protein